MKNPLRKRYLRELKTDFGKYLVIFLFMVMLISMVSGFLIADNNFKNSYDEGFEKYNIEDGHIIFDKEPSDKILSELEDKAKLKLYDLKYFEKTLDNTKANIRVYEKREFVNLECVMSGELPKGKNEIALDRMFAQNNDIMVGDTISLEGKELVVSGYIAAPDYSCLFENNTDMMFDAINFSIAVMTKEGFEDNKANTVFYNYAWKYNVTPVDDIEENDRSEELIDILEDIIKEYDINILQVQVDEVFDKADILQEKLENSFEDATSVIEEKMTRASETAAKKAIENLDQMELFTLVSQGYEGEALVKEAVKLQDTTLMALIAKELGTDENTLQDMLDLAEGLEEKTDELTKSKGERIDLHDLEDADEYENDMDYSFDEIYEVLDKIDAIKIYDTGVIRDTLRELEKLSDFELDESQVLGVDDYVARYNNNAINFTGDDMGKDAVVFTIFGYIVIVILAFVFAVTISNTISQEASTIGTLRASGFTRGEMVRHYLFLPVLVTVISAIVGNILGYTVFKDYCVEMYYGSYSLATYEDLWNSDAFIKTTVVPIILMFIINLLVLTVKLKLTPLQFIKRQLSNKQKKKAIHLSRKIPFMHRFRMRIFFQNLSTYITLFAGIFLGAVIIIFGTMFVPLLDDYSELVKNSTISKYQYVLINQAETKNESAEKYSLKSLDYNKEGYITDSISVYGISEDSKYIIASIPENKALVSNGFMDKYDLKIGDEVILAEHFGRETYSFIIAGEYKYDAAMAVFINQKDYISIFNEKEDFFTGYFSNSELSDVEADDIATVITENDLTKMAEQLKKSMGDFMSIFQCFGIIMFVLLMYLLTKQIIEKNMVSISMTKILGFKSSEIGGLYLLMTSLVVLASLLISIPITDVVLRLIFKKMLYTMMSGYIPYIVSKDSYIIMVILGIASYLAVCIFMMFKINKIPKSEALKNVE